MPVLPGILFVNFLVCIIVNRCVLLIQEYGMTALAWAASEGHEEIVDMLLNAEANPNIQDKLNIENQYY